MRRALVAALLALALAAPAAAQEPSPSPLPEPMPFADYMALRQAFADEGNPSFGDPAYLGWAESRLAMVSAIVPEACYASHHDRIVEMETWVLGQLPGLLEKVKEDYSALFLEIGQLVFVTNMLFPDMVYPVETEEGSMRIGPDEQVDVLRYLDTADC